MGVAEVNLRNINIFALTSALLFGPISAFAVPIVYTSEASWLTALGGAAVTTEDFSSSPSGVLAAGTTDLGLFDVTITSNAEGQIGVFSEILNGDIDADSTLSMVFSNFDVTPLIGFAGDWGSTTTGDLLTITINGTTIQFDNFLAGSGDGFLGFIDTDSFTSLTFGTEGTTTFGEFFTLDNVQVATSSVPEPGILALLTIGLLGIRFAKKA